MNKKSTYSLRRVCLGFVALFLTGSNALWAGPPEPDAAVARWLKQPLATGNWGGIRDRLAKEGVNVRFTWRSQLNKVVDGGLDRSTASFQQEFKLALGLDLEKLLGIPGLGFDAVGRWRDGTNALQLAGSSAQFSPSNMEGGKSWRLSTIDLTWKSEQLLWTEDAVKARIGWLRPVDTFPSTNREHFRK